MKGLEKFKNYTNKTINPFTNLFDYSDITTFNKCYRQWEKLLDETLHKCFTKFRYNQSNPKQSENLTTLYDELSNLETKINLSPLNLSLLTKQQNTLSKISEKNKTYDTLFNDIQQLSNTEQLDPNSFYRIKRKYLVKYEPKTAVLDESGSMLTSPECVKQAYMQEFQSRLTGYPLDSTFEHLENRINELFRLCINISANNSIQPFTLEDIESAISSLRPNQSGDIFDMKTEIFINSCHSLKMSLVKMFNLIRKSKSIPDSWNDILLCIFYKKKGDRN